MMATVVAYGIDPYVPEEVVLAVREEIKKLHDEDYLFVLLDAEVFPTGEVDIKVVGYRNEREAHEELVEQGISPLEAANIIKQAIVNGYTDELLDDGVDFALYLVYTPTTLTLLNEMEEEGVKVEEPLLSSIEEKASVAQLTEKEQSTPDALPSEEKEPEKKKEQKTEEKKRKLESKKKEKEEEYITLILS